MRKKALWQLFSIQLVLSLISWISFECFST